MPDDDEPERSVDQHDRHVEASSEDDDSNGGVDANEDQSLQDGEEDTKESANVEASETNDDEDNDDVNSIMAETEDGDEVDTVESEGDGASTGTPTTSEGGDSHKKHKKSSPVSASKSGRRGRTPSVAGLTIPFRTVKKAMKLDPDTPIVQNEAAIMTTIAAELFLKRLAKESFHSAKLRGRNTIRYEDIAEARTKNASMTFLETLFP
jgi:histone H3/H4